MTTDDRVVGNVLDYWAAVKPDAHFLTMGTDSFTFAAVADRAHAVASGFAELGIGRGERVAVISPNRLEMADLYLGLAKLGAVQVPLNAFLKGEFLRYQLTDSQAVALVVDAAGRDALIPLLDELPQLRLLITMDECEPLGRKGLVEVDFTETLTTTSVRVDLPEIDRADVMSIMYTSGTTGLPKGCVLTHGYYTRVAQVVGEALEFADDDSIYTTLPLFHAGGRMMTLGAALRRGIPVTIDAAFSPATLLPRCKEVDASIVVGMGVMGAAMLSLPEDPRDTDHRVHTMWMAPMAPADQERFGERFGIDAYVETFGQTECVPVLANRRGGLRNRASCGGPATDLEVALLDDSGRPVPDGEVGEICLRPRDRFAMFSGYWGKPEATLEAFTGLWYHTGDNGRRTDDGSIAFSDRKKDSMRRRGENVSSMELEAAILTHPSVAEVAVHAVASDLAEDDIKACIVPIADVELTPGELFAFFSNRLPYFAVPRYVELVESLPRNAVGRVMKHQLRDRPSTDAVWDFDALGLIVARADRRATTA